MRPKAQPREGSETPSRTAVDPAAPAIEDTIFGLLARRRKGSTICPSEVARALVPDEVPWRELMPRVRQVAQALAQENRIVVTRGGVPVDAMSDGGPIRLGLPIE